MFPNQAILKVISLPILVKGIKFFVDNIKNIFKNRDISKTDLNTSDGVVNLGEELNKFNNELEKSFNEIELDIVRKITEQLNQYLDLINKLEEYPQIKKNTLNKMRRDIGKYLKGIPGTLLRKSKSNISIDNNSLINILKLENNSTKDRLVDEFMISNTKKSLNEYAEEISEDLNIFSQDIMEEFEDLLSEIEEEKLTELSEFKNIEQKIENSLDKKRYLCKLLSEKSILKIILAGE